MSRARETAAWRERIGSVLLPAWGVRGLGMVAIAIAVGLPFAAGAMGWIGLTVEPVDAAPVDEAELRRGELRPRLIALPGGTFMMGSPDGVGAEDEHPQREVRVGPFELCETEVSVLHYWLVTGERPSDCDFGCADEHPVNRVSWIDAVEYLNTLTRLDNRGRPADQQLTQCYEPTTWAWDRSCTGYRLPTEAEWEYAARAGTTTAWSFGDDATRLCEYANVDATECEDGFEKLAPVQTDALKPNPWFLHGMHGNVWEWVYDWYDPGFYRSADSSDSINDKAGDSRVLRGGSFVWSRDARSANRLWYHPEFRDRSFGFRCARGAVPQP